MTIRQVARHEISANRVFHSGEWSQGTNGASRVRDALAPFPCAEMFLCLTIGCSGRRSTPPLNRTVKRTLRSAGAALGVRLMGASCARSWAACSRRSRPPNFSLEPTPLPLHCVRGRGCGYAWPRRRSGACAWRLGVRHSSRPLYAKDNLETMSDANLRT